MPDNKQEVLKKYFGYDAFRPQQADIIDTVMADKDCLVLMPTGGGKSVCFQIPAILRNGLTIVISPLIALMKDQVEALRSNGINAAFLNSSLSSSEQDQVMWQAKVGELKLLYIAPERLFSGNTFEFLKDWNVSLFAIDESHCISSWGHDFRPEYRQLNTLKLRFPNVPVIALTATADRVTRRDILKQLNIENAEIFVASFDRPNLSLTVLPGRKRLQQIQSFINKHDSQPGIIYCLSRKGTETVAASLQSAGFKADFYHAGLAPEKRSRVQEQFLKDDIQIIVATIAFGMGIDKSNVRWVIHYNLPSNVESFYQEIGRAGRDGSPSDTVLFYSYLDIITRQDMINNSDQSAEQKELLHAKLNRMKQYAEADICRRRILLSYFNEAVDKDCGNCDVCQNPRTRFDATIIAQKALSGIARTNQKVAMGMLIDILRGSRNRNVLHYGYEQLPTFGVGTELRGEEWAEYISQLLNSGAMDIAYDEAHAFKLNPVSRQILKGERKVELVKFIPLAERKAREEELVLKEKPKQEIIRDALFERLRMMRKQMADALGVPPYVVFSDATLSEMAQKKPVSEAQMKAVSGIGAEKFRRYGETFINEIVAFAKENTKPGTRVVKGMTYIETLDLYKEGYSVKVIAEKRELNAVTIISHLIKLKEDGHDINLKKLIDHKALTTITQAAREIQVGKNDPLKPLFELLNEQFDYGQIRLALALSEDEDPF
ncbi:DNA helicase RecQ [Dyadobacter sediminis]|uniref:DNA helicase RecQ n=1 Tax=Dyadobacter sediminis TaxID=1493691 RepID=A0A5R9K625_9BACT|nr:DNA helicase RecQ [Dyadobacter sediminis]TLU89112.1 DNA helicase RecQ [Dyadobacter sediminis]GGC02681.1 ATP-dependent DNA helicase RecQ [Dyadobacter sediminis]